MVLIFDTDSGFFADDGAALTILLRSTLASSVRGITVVSGNVWAAKGVEYMRRNARLLKHPRLPVLLGAQKPLVHTAAMVKREGTIQFAGALGETPVVASPAKQNAIEFIIDTIDRSPGQVTFVALGPMTNLAIALRLRPDIAAKMAALVFMGGAVKVAGNCTAKAEFNFWFDPEAAQAVLRSSIPKKVMFGLDITNQAPLRKADFDDIVATTTAITTLYAQDLGNQFPAFYKNPQAVTYIWDALVSAWLVDSSVVLDWASMTLDVVTEFGPSYGSVVTLDRSFAPAAGPVQIALRLDRAKAWKIYRTALTKLD